MANEPKSAPPSPPPTPRLETFKRQVQTLREIGASEKVIRIAESAAKAAAGK
jgi:hypothetical protein